MITKTIMRSFISIIFLFVLTKLMGKKQISQLNLYDYIVDITIGNVAAESALNQKAFLSGLIIMIIYTSISLFLSYITNKSILMRRIVTGVPIILIAKGKILDKNLGKVKIDINDLLQQARTNNCFDISEIEYAIMEPNGQISFLLKPSFLPLTPELIKKTNLSTGICANLIIDGKILTNNLKNIHKDKSWLFQILSLKHLNIKDIILLTCDNNGKISIYKKQKIETDYTILE